MRLNVSETYINIPKVDPLYNFSEASVKLHLSV